MAGGPLGKIFFSRLIVAVPELNYNASALLLAKEAGWIDEATYNAAIAYMRTHKKAAAFGSKMKGKTLIGRLNLVANELLSVQSVNFLRKLGLIEKTEAHALRLALRAANRFVSPNVSEATILQRMKSSLGSGFSKEAVDLLRSLEASQIESIRQAIYQKTGKKVLGKADSLYIEGLIRNSIKRAETMRSAIRLGRKVSDAVKDARKAESLIQALTVFSGGTFDKEIINLMLKAKLITAKQANTMQFMSNIGWDMWRKGAKAFDYKSWSARAMMISQGFLNPELISFGVQNGWITKEQARLMYPAANAIREMLRQKIISIEDLAGLRYRMPFGANPLQQYLNATKHTDAQILKLLGQASRDASKEAELLMRANKFGAMTRARQQQVLAAKLHEEMRALWENVGHMTIFGERQAAAAGISAMDDLMETAYKGKNAQQMITAASRAGVDSYIGRQSNLLDLSDKVYSWTSFFNGRLDKEINKSLLRGQSASEMAKTVEKFINPSVPGGVRSAAMRLSRTEINNAFHNAQINHTRDMPWVRGYKWHLSGSHPKPDECNDYEEHDEGMGPGVYGKKDVPQKPHPNCLCYITVYLDKPGKFEKRLREGTYDKYLNQVQRSGMPGPGGGIDLTNAALWAARNAGPVLVPFAVRAARQAPDFIARMRIVGLQKSRVVKGNIAAKFSRKPDFTGFKESSWGKGLTRGNPNVHSNNAVELYTWDLADPVNKALRLSKGVLETDDIWSAVDNDYRHITSENLSLLDYSAETDLRHIVGSMDDNFGRIIDDTLVYRIMNIDHIKNLKAGEFFVDYGYTSTEMASRYYDGHKFVFTLDPGPLSRAKYYLPKGSLGTFGADSERELILGRGSTFKLVGKTPSLDPKFVWDLEFLMLQDIPRLGSFEKAWKLLDEMLGFDDWK